MLQVMLFSLRKFQELFDDNEYLQQVLSPNPDNTWDILVDETEAIEFFLKKNNIKYKIK